MNDAPKYELGGDAALAEFGTLGAYSQNIIDTHAAALITLGIGAFLVGAHVIDYAYECLKNVANNANELYRNLIKG